MAKTDQQIIASLREQINETDEQIRYHQDTLRAWLMKQLAQIGLDDYIDGSGSDGDWDDLTRSEVMQAVNRLVEEITEQRLELVHASKASRDVFGERHRQINAEGWTPKHDDEHGDGALAEAAAVYALSERQIEIIRYRGGSISELFPEWPYKPKDRRRDLVRAGALILAEIERLDRAAAKAGG